MRLILRLITAPFRFIFRIFRSIGSWFSNSRDNFRSFFSDEPEDSPLAESFSKTIEHPTDILVHLDALRKHLMRSVLALLLATAVAFAFSSQIMHFLAQPVEGGLDAMRAIDPTEPLGTVMKVSLLTGFAVSLPYIVFELYLFISPGISVRARMWGLLAIPAAFGLFVAGLVFAYFVVLPPSMNILLNWGGMQTQLRPSSYFNFITRLLFWIGISFEFPLIIYLTAAFGWVDAKTLLKQWRIAVILIAVVAAVVTPTIDPYTMMVVMMPLIVLYFLGIALAAVAQRGRKKKQLALEEE
jgi:sec-independent protein translocase protein TatC